MRFGRCLSLGYSFGRRGVSSLEYSEYGIIGVRNTPSSFACGVGSSLAGLSLSPTGFFLLKISRKAISQRTINSIYCFIFFSLFFVFFPKKVSSIIFIESFGIIKYLEKSKSKAFKSFA